MEFAQGFPIVGVEACCFRIEGLDGDQIVGDGGDVTSRLFRYARNEIVQLQLNGILSHVALQTTMGESTHKKQDIEGDIRE